MEQNNRINRAFTQQDIERHLQSALAAATPDVWSKLDLTVPQEKPARQPKVLRLERRLRRLGAAAAACVCLTVAGGGYYHYEYLQVASQVEIDVNPSLKLSLNRRERVLCAEALNEDAADLVDSSSLKGKPVEQAVGQVVDSLVEKGYLQQGEEQALLVSVSGKNEAKARQLKDTVSAHVENTLSEKEVPAVVYDQVIQVTRELEELAETYQVSVGKAEFVGQLVSENDTLNQNQQDAYSRMMSQTMEEITQEIDDNAYLVSSKVTIIRTEPVKSHQRPGDRDRERRYADAETEGNKINQESEDTKATDRDDKLQKENAGKIADAANVGKAADAANAGKIADAENVEKAENIGKTEDGGASGGLAGSASSAPSGDGSAISAGDAAEVSDGDDKDIADDRNPDGAGDSAESDANGMKRGHGAGEAEQPAEQLASINEQGAEAGVQALPEGTDEEGEQMLSEEPIESGEQMPSKEPIESGGQMPSEEQIETGEQMPSEERIESGGQMPSEEQIESGGQMPPEEQIESGAQVLPEKGAETGSEMHLEEQPVDIQALPEKKAEDSAQNFSKEEIQTDSATEQPADELDVGSMKASGKEEMPEPAQPAVETALEESKLSGTFEVSETPETSETPEMLEIPELPERAEESRPAKEELSEVGAESKAGEADRDEKEAAVSGEAAKPAPLDRVEEAAWDELENHASNGSKASVRRPKAPAAPDGPGELADFDDEMDEESGSRIIHSPSHRLDTFEPGDMASRIESGTTTTRSGTQIIFEAVEKKEWKEPVYASEFLTGSERRLLQKGPGIFSGDVPEEDQKAILGCGPGFSAFGRETGKFGQIEDDIFLECGFLGLHIRTIAHSTH